MSISIYYTAKRKISLSLAEMNDIKSIVSKYSVEHLIEKFLQTGSGLNWEAFFYQFNLGSTENVFDGSTKLPDISEEGTWEGVQHWCACLSEIRNRIPNATWEVQVEDHTIQWNSTEKAYDPWL